MRAALKFFLFFSTVAVFSFFLFLKPTHAQFAAPNIPVDTAANVPSTFHNYSQSVFLELLSSLNCQLTGIDVSNSNSTCLGFDNKTGQIGFVQGGTGAIGGVSSLISVLYNPPLHATDYLAYLGKNFGIAKSAYAASGYESLEPLQNIWQAFTNIVYLLFVLVFIFIGVAIMLRVKVDPRTVMSFQNQIPKIIIGLVLVTFSFAIAGFLIDLMYVSIFLFYNLLSGIDPNIRGVITAQMLQGSPAPEIAKSLVGDPKVGPNVWQVGWHLGTVLKDILGIDPYSPKNAIPLFNLGSSTIDLGRSGNPLNLLIDLVSSAVGVWGGVVTGSAFDIPILGAVIGGTVAGSAIMTTAEFIIRDFGINFVVMLVLAIAILFSLIRVWVTLLIAYVSILIEIIFAPFWILAGALPGSKAGFGSWLRALAANILAFPAVVIIFLLAKVFMDGFDGAPGAVFVPPLVGNPGKGMIGALIGLGMIFFAPSAVKMVQAALKSPKIDLGTMFAPIGSAGKTIGQTVGRTTRTGFYARQGTIYDKESHAGKPEGKFSRYVRGAIAGR